MFDFTDLWGCLPSRDQCPNTISAIINSRPDLTKFSHILKIAGLESIYGDQQADFTIFVFSDNSFTHESDQFFESMDRSTARNVIRSCTLKRKIPSEILEYSPSSSFVTVNPASRLTITNINNVTYINHHIMIREKDILASNGIIHIADGIISVSQL